MVAVAVQLTHYQQIRGQRCILQLSPLPILSLVSRATGFASCVCVQHQHRNTSWCQQFKSTLKPRSTLSCAAAGSGGQGKQFETELFRKLFGAPPPPKQDDAGGGGDKPPGDDSVVYEEEEEPDEDQIRLAKLRARQQALFNCISILLFLGIASVASTWKPHFLFLGRIWQMVRVDNRTQSYAELGSEGLVWGLLLSMGWPWNLLIYPTHLTRKEFTNARKELRAPSAKRIRDSVWNPFARKPRPRPQPVQPQAV